MNQSKQDHFVIEINAESDLELFERLKMNLENTFDYMISEEDMYQYFTNLDLQCKKKQKQLTQQNYLQLRKKYKSIKAELAKVNDRLNKIENGVCNSTEFIYIQNYSQSDLQSFYELKQYLEASFNNMLFQEQMYQKFDSQQLQHLKQITKQNYLQQQEYYKKTKCKLGKVNDRLNKIKYRIQDQSEFKYNFHDQQNYIALSNKLKQYLEAAFNNMLFQEDRYQQLLKIDSQWPRLRRQKVMQNCLEWRNCYKQIKAKLEQVNDQIKKIQNYSTKFKYIYDDQKNKLQNRPMENFELVITSMSLQDIQKFKNMNLNRKKRRELQKYSKQKSNKVQQQKANDRLNEAEVYDEDQFNISQSDLTLRRILKKKLEKVFNIMLIDEDNYQNSKKKNSEQSQQIKQIAKQKYLEAQKKYKSIKVKLQEVNDRLNNMNTKVYDSTEFKY